MLVADGHNCLVRVDAVAEDRLKDGTYSPLTLALAVVADAGRVLIVRNRARQRWELPGGMIEPGERPRDAAVRELAEETGQHATDVRFIAVATYRLGPDGRREHGAVFRAAIAPGRPLVPSDANEIEQVRWWDQTSDIGPVDPLDAAVTTFALRH